MQETCLRCHASSSVARFYEEAEAVLAATNERVREGQALMAALRAEGLLTAEPFDEPIEFLYFDFWHYFGRTAKHGAFAGCCRASGSDVFWTAVDRSHWRHEDRGHSVAPSRCGCWRLRSCWLSSASRRR